MDEVFTYGPTIIEAIRPAIGHSTFFSIVSLRCAKFIIDNPNMKRFIAPYKKAGL
jgi:hypothetical protein